jgi:hypothetical protein
MIAAMPIRGTIRAATSAVVLALALAAASAAQARRHNPPPPSPLPAGSGYDISYPQCSSGYPTDGGFGIVGVNGGLANDANGCLGSELAWAKAKPGLTSPSQPPASVYINTADPGNGVADWPSPSKGTAGGTTPYGTCDGSWSQACSYVYGQQRAAYSYGLVSGIDSSLAASAPWWLDIETVNSWATSSDSSNWAALNVATIQGFIAGLQGKGATGAIGIYSTASQWGAITNQNATTSSFPNIPDWVAGAGSYSQAQANCKASFSGGRVALAQYPWNGFDADYACP